jgi:hypothetical protein
MDLIQLNKFSELHNGNKIIFCKTDFIFEEFEKISKIPNDIILITGNSDYPIDDLRFSLKPNNVKKWFAQNALINNEILIPLPIGIENKFPSFRPNHGVGYGDRVIEKENLLSRNLIVNPSKKYYSNFNVFTNYSYRSTIKDICIKTPHIEWEDPNLSLLNFFDKILDYEAIICPIGNGIDTHRLWEVIYSNRIPITIKTGNFKIYNLYEKLPIIILENENELYDEKLLDNKLTEIKNKKYNLKLLDFSYWKNCIIGEKF